MQGVVLLAFLFAATAGEVVFIPTPDAILPGLSQTLDLNCSLTHNSTDVDRLLIIQIGKINGSALLPLASVTTGERAKLDTGYSGSHAHVTGVVSDNDPSESFLQLSLRDPTTADAGVYACAMSVLDQSYLLQKIQATTNVTLTDATDADVTAAVIKELRSLQRQVSSLSKRVEDPSSSTTSGGCACLGGAAAAGDLPTLAPAPLVAFTARPRVARPFRSGRLLYDTVDVNVGGAYDAARSQFLAPVNGTYLFSASLSSQTAKTISELRVNNYTKGQLATLGDDQTTLSLVLQLLPGDKVWVEGIFSSINDSLIFADNDTLFSGYLIRGL